MKLSELKKSFDWDSLRSKYSKTEQLHRIDLFNNSGAVGYIEWDKDTGEIETIFVGRPYRRQGLGAKLWKLAVKHAKDHDVVEPEHSSRRTKEGDAFARSIGGYIPELTDDVDGWSTR